MLRAWAPKIASRRIWPASHRLHPFLTLPSDQSWRRSPPILTPALDRSQARAGPLNIPCRRSLSSQADSKGPALHLGNDSDSSRVKQAKPVIEVIDRGGQKIKREIDASYPDKPKAVENLLKRLSTLRLLESPSGTPHNSHGWELDPSGYILHRYTSYNSYEDLKQARREINRAAEELNHDPHIFEAVTKGTNLPHMLISCTTHYPAGLSVKDAKLAQAVDQILERIGERDDTKDEVLSEAEILAHRKEAYTHNLANINDNCSCARDHKV